MIRQTPTDYRNLNNWMEIPRHLDYKVDIFYLYPTAYFKSAASPMICSVNHQAMRDRATDHLTHKGSAFRTVGNYFVPFYRQAAIQCLLSEKEEDTQDFFDQTVTDVCTAFDYYLKNLNGGRPFILAGHSQGSILLSILLATTFKKHPHYLHQLVAAYIIGYGITPKYLADNPHLSFATGATDTGVIISYNTEAPGVKGENITLPAGSMAINPITWTRDETTAPASSSRGSHLVLRDAQGNLEAIKDLTHYADARVDATRGVVVCSTANPSDFRIVGAENYFPRGVLHNGDYCLYYYDLRQNAQDRVAAYLSRPGMTFTQPTSH